MKSIYITTAGNLHTILKLLYASGVKHTGNQTFDEVFQKYREENYPFIHVNFEDGEKVFSGSSFFFGFRCLDYNVPDDLAIMIDFLFKSPPIKLTTEHGGVCVVEKELVNVGCSILTRTDLENILDAMDR